MVAVVQAKMSLLRPLERPSPVFLERDGQVVDAGRTAVRRARSRLVERRSWWLESAGWCRTSGGCLQYPSPTAAMPQWVFIDAVGSNGFTCSADIQNVPQGNATKVRC